ncbi:hypothetical protein FisN_30Hu063 [Fistulifera solaris]|uniref:Uncharacterized protein n=1 Tax=Fistulifera solaris TaxID=1519565 RepID=A0A1Z5K6S0_FISSO|nr:hypothetical protein FisN_30Hu063 [Fistulifera solaris]|eukprot:GAX21862.1 hypothetical protein FisN_30Hu063 [Fistulifera solaris]
MADLGDEILFINGNYKGQMGWLHPQGLTTKYKAWVIVTLNGVRTPKLVDKGSFMLMDIEIDENLPLYEAIVFMRSYPDALVMMTKMCKFLAKCNLEPEQVLVIAQFFKELLDGTITEYHARPNPLFYAKPAKKNNGSKRNRSTNRN